MDEAVTVIGSGSAGLACAAELTRRGVPTQVLERGENVAAAWAQRYDSLRFNTSRRLSALPGAPFPRQWGQFPTRDQYVGYLRDYADRHRVQVRTGVSVARIEPNGGHWRLHTDAGPIDTATVVVATGGFNQPTLPPWAERHEFVGRLLHSVDYRDPAPFVGQRVVIVGAGSTGMEIANELARGGARSVHLAYRTPPNILYRTMGGLPADLPVPLFLHLPTPVVDRLMSFMQRRVIGDLSGYGLPRPTEGVMTGLKLRGTGTAIVDREVVAAIRDGLVRVVPEVRALIGDAVVISDGRQLAADAVIVATGFRTGLHELVGHLDVLDERGLPLDRTGGELAPGLRFVGYTYRPGITGYVGRTARRVAREIAAGRTAAPPVPAGSTPRAWRTPTSHARGPSPD